MTSEIKSIKKLESLVMKVMSKMENHYEQIIRDLKDGKEVSKTDLKFLKSWKAIQKAENRFQKKIKK